MRKTISGAAPRRVAEYGDGWIGLNVSPEEAALKIRRIEHVLSENDRQRSDVGRTRGKIIYPASQQRRPHSPLPFGAGNRFDPFANALR